MSTRAATRLRILQAVEDGQVSAREAERLLAALDRTEQTTEVMLRFLVVETATGRARIDLALPLAVWDGFAQLGLQPDVLWGLPGAIDANEVVKAAHEGAKGLLAEAEDEVIGLRVSISVDDA